MSAEQGVGVPLRARESAPEPGQTACAELTASHGTTNELGDGSHSSAAKSHSQPRLAAVRAADLDQAELKVFIGTLSSRKPLAVPDPISPAGEPMRAAFVSARNSEIGRPMHGSLWASRATPDSRRSLPI